MRRHGNIWVSLVLIVSIIFSACQNNLNTTDAVRTLETRAYGDKTPKIVTYIDVNDTNPLNAMLYRMDNESFIDMVTIFAANIRANGSEPQLWLNDNVTKILVPDAGSTTTGHYKYVQPLRQDGAKVLLTILGDHQGVGVGNLTEANQQKFAEILAWAVEEYDLDGIDFDDEWANYGENPNFPSSVDGSFSGLIIKLRNELDERFPNEHKLITVLNIGNASTLSSDAIADCDFGWSGNFGPNTYNSNPILWPKEKWAAQAIDLSQLCSPNMYILNQISTRCTQTLNDGMGAILTYGLRNHTECDPLPVLQRIASTIFSNTVTRSSTPANGYTKDWSGDSGTAITYDDID